MHDLVSIIIPCYNKSQYIGEAIESALNQTYSNIEIIVVDDGSTDDSLEQIKRFVSKGITLVQQENQGVCVARNNAIRQSSGEYIVPLDADDILAPTYVERCIDCFLLHPDTTLVYTACSLIGQRHGKMGNHYDYTTMLWYSLLPATSMYRRIDFDHTTGYNPNMLYALEDWDFYLSLLHECDHVEYIDECLFHYRILPNSRNTNINVHQEDIFRQVYNNHRQLYEPYNDLLLHANDRWHEYERLYKEVYHSKAYHIGKCLLRPFSRLRQQLLNR